MSYEFPSFIFGIAGFLIGLYLLADMRIRRRKSTTYKIGKENHAKEEIYNVFRSIQEVRKQRERIRTMNPQNHPDVDLESETRFMSGKLTKVIESLQFTLSLYNEHLSDKFTSRVKDAVNGYDFLLQRLEQFPLESDDPSNVLGGDIEGFIDELKMIS